MEVSTRAGDVIRSLRDVLHIRPTLLGIVAGDPRIFTGVLVPNVGRRRRMTLSDMWELQDDAVKLAERIAKCEQFLAVVRDKVSRGLQPMIGEKPYDTSRIPADSAKLAGLRVELERKEADILKVWTDYLQAQASKQIVFQRSSDSRLVVMSLRPILGLPAGSQNWLPEDVCIALRVGRTLGYPANCAECESVGEFLDKFCQVDPVELCKPAPAKRVNTRAEKVEAMVAAGQTELFQAEAIPRQERKKKGAVNKKDPKATGQGLTS